jgi:hypothetical protein
MLRTGITGTTAGPLIGAGLQTPGAGAAVPPTDDAANQVRGADNPPTAAALPTLAVGTAPPKVAATKEPGAGGVTTAEANPGDAAAAAGAGAPTGLASARAPISALVVDAPVRACPLMESRASRAADRLADGDASRCSARTMVDDTACSCAV